jgi:predicted outer membrane repeat protein
METRRKLRIVATVGVLVVCWAASAKAKIIYVDDDATGANSGLSWVDAFVHLQNALAVAQAGDEVRVAQGRYRPDQDARVATAHGHGVEISPSGLPNVSFRLENGVAIRGGFAGVPAPDPNVRSVGQYETILSGDLKENDSSSWQPGSPAYESLRDDNSLYVVESRDTDATAVLDGFTIQSAIQSGMHNLRGSPRVMNCTFRQNSARNLSGGALFCEGGEPSLSNCVFRENSATVAGGAIHASAAHLKLADCRFVTNQGRQSGRRDLQRQQRRFAHRLHVRAEHGPAGRGCLSPARLTRRDEVPICGQCSKCGRRGHQQRRRTLDAGDVLLEWQSGLVRRRDTSIQRIFP